MPKERPDLAHILRGNIASKIETSTIVPEKFQNLEFDHQAQDYVRIFDRACVALNSKLKEQTSFD